MTVENNVHIQAVKNKYLRKNKQKKNGLKFSQCMSQQPMQCCGNKMILVT